MDVNPSSENGEDQSFFEHPLDFLSIFLGNVEDEHSFFPSTPLCDSSNHEDVDQHPEFYDLGFHDLFTSSFDHDVDSLVVNPSMPLVYNDPSVKEVETPHTVKALQPKLMVIPGPCCPKIGFTSDQEIVQT